MSALWQGLLELLRDTLVFFHDVTAPLFGEQAAWGWGIVLLTVAVRLFLLPLAVKQTRSQRAMQRLQPQMKKVQAKYKADRGLMRSNPEKYREQRQKQQEAMMALYKEHGVNPAAGCLPLIAQMPIFFALYRVLLDTGRLQGLESPFYFLGSLSSTPPEAPVAWLLVALMAVTTFFSSRQMMTSTAVTGQQQQQQKMLMYVMPVMLTVFAYQLPVGVLLYWVTTNLWTMAQQWVMFRNVEQVRAAVSR